MSNNSTDTYDELLAKNDCTFRRAQSDLPKSDGLTILHSLGFDVPKHGVVREMMDTLIRDMYKGDKEAAKADPAYALYEVVVIDDVNVHDPSSLTKMHVEEALNKHPDKYAMQYIPTRTPLTYTMFKAGKKVYWYETKSKDTFRSNCGPDVEMRILDGDQFAKMQGIDESVFEAFNMPVVSIDFIAAGRRGSLYAVDINAAPIIRGTPLEEFSDEIAEQVYYSIKELNSGKKDTSSNDDVQQTGVDSK